MRLPSPDDPDLAAIWKNYVIAQATRAAVGLIPPSALAVGAAVDGTQVTLVFQLSEPPSERDQEDVDYFDISTGFIIDISLRVDVRDGRDFASFDDVYWFYACHD